MIKVYFYDPATFQIYTEAEVENTNGLEHFTTVAPPEVEWNQYPVYDPNSRKYKVITIERMPEEARLQRLDWWNKRRATYPDIGVQLDKLFDDIKTGKFGESAKQGDWYQTIQEIKNRIPKE